MIIKKAKNIQGGETLKLATGERLKVLNKSKGFAKIQYQGSTKTAIFFEFGKEIWSQVHPDEEFEIIS